MIPLRKVYEITGYVVNECSVLCPQCYEDWKADFIDKQNNGIYPTLDNPEGTPIFLGDEWEYPPVCEQCLEEIEVNIIDQ